SGGYDRQVRRVRLAYRRRRDRLVGAVRAGAPQGGGTGVGARLHAPFGLSPGEGEDAGAAPAGPRGRGLRGAGALRPGGGEGGRVVGYATPPGHAYSTAVARLCAVLSADG